MDKFDYNCPNCKINSLHIKPMKNSLFNPIKLKCKKYKCRKLINIRDKSFFSFFPKTTVSVIIKVIELFILEQKNCIEIIKSLQDFYQVNNVNTKIIYSIVNLVRTAISLYLKEIYQNPMLEKNKNGIIAIDESLPSKLYYNYLKIFKKYISLHPNRFF